VANATNKRTATPPYVIAELKGTIPVMEANKLDWS